MILFKKIKFKINKPMYLLGKFNKVFMRLKTYNNMRNRNTVCIILNL